jgi:hypothetical protein
MILGWDPSQNTDQENERYSHLRAIEWSSYIVFICPLITPFLILWLGWVEAIILTVIAEYVWIFVFADNPSFRVVSSLVLPVNVLKWPISIILAVVYYFDRHNLILSTLLALFPILSWFLMFLEIPAMKIKNIQIGILEKKLLKQMGYDIEV